MNTGTMYNLLRKSRLPLTISLTTAPFTALASTPTETSPAERPNILVVVCEDISPYLGCYGDPVAVTPNLDRFSQEAVRFNNMHTCVGVSSPSRFSLITGRYASEDGANFMRVNYFNKAYSCVLPDGVKCYSEFMRQAGYYCTNNSKTDYQFEAPISAWDEQGVKAHWKNAPEDQPFFAIFNLNSTHESQIWKTTDQPLAVDPAEVILPPYYPDTPTVRHDVAVMHSCIHRMDAQFQKLLSELEESGRADNTIVIFYSDNGGPLPRHKREIMDSGSRVPFMIRFPDRHGAGTVDENLHMFVDIPATILSLSGIRPPKYMHGQPFYGIYKTKKERKYVFGATDRFDEQVEKRASIRDERFQYIRNYMPEQSVYRPNKYRLSMPMMQEMVRLYEAGELNEVQSRWFTAPSYAEELYDCEADPYQIHNLVTDPAYKKVLKRMRKAYSREWIRRYNRNWVREPESFFVNRSWPDGHQPVCDKPDVSFEAGTLVVRNNLSEYSVSYKVEGQRQWNLYTAPILLEGGEKVSVLVERIGYASSESDYIIPEN